MKSDCYLIATLPAINRFADVQRVFANPDVSEVRFNTGTPSPFSIPETVQKLLDLSKRYNKKLWIDLKGRQLKVIKWADPLYSCIELNHRIKIEFPAKIYFRNDIPVNITHIKDGNKIFVVPLPRYKLGAGQSVNILARNLEVEGYLTETDKQYLFACKKLDINSIMASFVEKFDDLVEIFHILPKAEIISKIESEKGIEFICSNNITGLMAARDDLFIETGENYGMMNSLRTIISKDSNAICASRIFLSLEKRDTVDFADFADLELMYSVGYRRFMLCDNICNYRFAKAICAWREFING